MNDVKHKPPTLGVLYGNRDFFPDQLVTEAREDIAQVFARLGIRAIQLGDRIPSSAASKPTPTPANAPNFSVNTRAKSTACSSAAQFWRRKRRGRNAQNFEAQRAGAVQGYPDDLKQLSPARRRDAFCGKISVSNNLVQAGSNSH